MLKTKMKSPIQTLYKVNLLRDPSGGAVKIVILCRLNCCSIWSPVETIINTFIHHHHHNSPFHHFIFISPVQCPYRNLKPNMYVKFIQYWDVSKDFILLLMRIYKLVKLHQFCKEFSKESLWILFRVSSLACQIDLGVCFVKMCGVSWRKY